MPQYGVLVYAPPPADPMALAPEYLELLDGYPARVKEMGAKVLGGSYFSGQRGFAFESSAEAMAIRGDTVRSGPLVESELVPTAFYVVSAPDLDTAVKVAQLNPAVRDGGVEVRRLFVPQAE